MPDREQTTLDRRLHWYQRTGLWVAVAFLAVPLALVSLSVYIVADITIMAFAAPIVFALIPVGLWMAALVSRSGWAQGILSISTIVVLFLAAWAVWNFFQDVEAEAFQACSLIETPEGEIVEMDPELCESAFDGSIEALQRTTWIMFTVFGVAPLFGLYLLRKRFQPGRIASES